MQDVLEKITRTDWNSFAQPEWNKANTVPSMLLKTLNCREGMEQDVYSELLFALGNNHAGTYFPVVLPVIPILGDLLEVENVWAHMVVLSVFDDYLHSFQAEPAFDKVKSPDGSTQSLEALVRREIGLLRHSIQKIVDLNRPHEHSGEKQLAREILNELSRP